MKSYITPAFAILAWGLAAVLVWQMLSGVFEVRTCLTDCVQTLYISALAATVAGLIAAAVVWFRGQRDVLTMSSAAALVMLLGMFLTMMVIGSL